MGMTNGEVIQAIDRLIGLCQQSQRCYQELSRQTDSALVKISAQQRAQELARCIQDLSQEARRRGAALPVHRPRGMAGSGGGERATHSAGRLRLMTEGSSASSRSSAGGQHLESRETGESHHQQARSRGLPPPSNAKAGSRTEVVRSYSRLADGDDAEPASINGCLQLEEHCLQIYQRVRSAGLPQRLQHLLRHQEAGIEASIQRLARQRQRVGG